MDTQKIPLVSEKLIDSVAEELSPQQRHTLRQRARQYEDHLREARQEDPTIGPTGYMLGMIERRLDRIESNSKDASQMMMGMMERCQANRDALFGQCRSRGGVKFEAMDRRLTRMWWTDIGIASVLAAFLVGGRDLAITVIKAIWARIA